MGHAEHDKHQDFSIRKLNNRGSVMIAVAASLVGLFAFAVIAIDGAIMMTTKTQLQNAADSACLACVSGLAASGTVDQRVAWAEQRAIDFASYNYAVQDTLRTVDILPGDVEFTYENGRPTRCRVTTYRTSDHNDPLRTYFLKVLALGRANFTDVKATAVAEVFDICATTCIKPWAIPDRWDDANGNNAFDVEDWDDANNNGLYDPGEDFDDDNNNGVWDTEYYDPIVTGYLPPGDVGTQLIMHSSSNPGPIAPGQYYSIDLPPLGQEQAPLTGGSWYREWIRTCAPYSVAPGDSCQLEPGQMVGPTIQGILDLIAQDPLATWDPSTKSIANSAYGLSPRVALVPFYDPNFPPSQGRNYVKITKIGAFFLESVGPGSQVRARFMKVGVPGTPCDDSDAGPSFLVGLHLVE